MRVPISIAPGNNHAKEDECESDPERRGSSDSRSGCSRGREGSPRPVAGGREGVIHAIAMGYVEQRWDCPQGRKGCHGAESRVAQAPVPRKLVSSITTKICRWSTRRRKTNRLSSTLFHKTENPETSTTTTLGWCDFKSSRWGSDLSPSPAR